MTDVLVTGTAVLDFVFQLDALPDAAVKYRANDMRAVGGGNAANASVAIARLAGRPALVTRVGDDPIGQLILSDLRAEGVDCEFALVAEGGRSSLSTVSVDPAGERQVVNFRGEALHDEPGNLSAIDRDFKAVMVDTRWLEAAHSALRLAKARGIPGIVDAEPPCPSEMLAEASHVAFSSHGLRAFTGLEDKLDALHAAARILPGWVGVTDGAAGASFVEGGRINTVPAFAVKAIDTLGAGDVWHGAFALRLAEGAGEFDAVRFANAAAALKCTELGGRHAAPSRVQTEELLRVPA